MRFLRVGIIMEEAFKLWNVCLKVIEKRKANDEGAKLGGLWNIKRGEGRGRIPWQQAFLFPRKEYTWTLCQDCREPKRAVPCTYNEDESKSRVSISVRMPDHLKSPCPKVWAEHLSRREIEFAIKGNRVSRNNGKCIQGRLYNVNLLFDSGADFSFISTEFVSMPNVKPRIINPGYVIEIADGKRVEVNRVICDCKLELGNSLFTIDLIPLGHGSFDVIVGMDWLSRNKAVIVCHKKMVEIPLEGGEALRVHEECALGLDKTLMNANVGEPKMDEIPVVREFSNVFPEDLSGLPPQRQVEFCIELVAGAAPVARSPYRLAPSKMQELSGQLQELQDKGFIRPNHSLWGAHFWLQEVHFLGHVVNQNVNLCGSGKIEAVKNWEAPTSPTGVRLSYLGLGRRWIEFIYYYDVKYDITHSVKVNVGADALSRKERVKPKRVRAMAMTIHSGVKGMILAAQSEAFDQENVMNKVFNGWQLDVHLPLAEFSYNNSYHTSIGCSRFESTKGSKAARDRQKSYADNRHKPLEFEVGDRVMLKVSPWKGVVRFRNKGKMLREKFFSNAEPSCAIKGIKVGKTLHFIEEPVEILDREIKSLKRSKISLVKVRWDSKRGPKFIWEREDFMNLIILSCFVDRKLIDRQIKSSGRDFQKEGIL
ncbi:putative reverse transcriptase domain-containing protein [Tanacetum coccineum]|uniref:Reverse transcriptase domain-containing protein n=1 Tax=Tanacetum coccineum TaxID=301880 RepID=A0ABQ4Y3R8_9ASTR